MGDQDYAVVVGISRYPALSDLGGPANDAANMRDWLTSRDGGGLPQKNVKLIISPDPGRPMKRVNAIPTREQVIQAFEEIMEEERADGKIGERLYMYLAGHGFAPEVDDAALLMANASTKFLHHIPGRPYARWFHSTAKFDEIVLLMDCCRDDYVGVPPHVPPWVEEHSPFAARVRYFYGFATQVYRKAREKKLNKSEKVQGLFTTALIAALRMAVPDDQGIIWGHAVRNYVLNYMPELVGGDSYQEPTFDFNTERDIAFARAPAPRKLKLVVQFIGIDPARVTVLDKDFATVFEGALKDKRLELDLTPAKYLIQESGTGGRKPVDLIGAPGETIHVSFP